VVLPAKSRQSIPEFYSPVLRSLQDTQQIVSAPLQSHPPAFQTNRHCTYTCLLRSGISLQDEQLPVQTCVACTAAWLYTKIPDIISKCPDHFHLLRYVNGKNCRYACQEYLPEKAESLLSSSKVTVWRDTFHRHRTSHL